MNRFDWSLIPSFIAVIEKGNLSQAAKSIQSSQPTISRHIYELEQQLETLLFDRTHKGLKPTIHAEKLYEIAKTMQQSAFDIERHSAATMTALSGKVRLTATQPVAYSLLMPVLAEFKQSHPSIDVELVVSNHMDNLLEREADIAIRMTRPTQMELTAKKLANLPIGFFAHIDYLHKHGEPKTLAELVNHQLIGDDKNHAIITGAKAYGWTLSSSDFRFRTDDLFAQWQAVKSGIGIGVVSQHLAVQEDKIMRVLADQFHYELPMWLTAHRELTSNAVMRVTFDFLSERLRDEGATR